MWNNKTNTHTHAHIKHTRAHDNTFLLLKRETRGEERKRQRERKKEKVNIIMMTFSCFLSLFVLFPNFLDLRGTIMHIDVISSMSLQIISSLFFSPKSRLTNFHAHQITKKLLTKFEKTK